MKNHWCESCESVVRIVDAIPVSMSYGEYIKVKFRCQLPRVQDPWLVAESSRESATISD